MSKNLIRTDAGELARPVRRVSGGVVFTGRAARVGSHVYPWGVERRDEAELRRIVAQLPGIPVVVHHPRTFLGEGGTATIVGTVLRSWVADGHAVTEIRVDDEHALIQIEGGADQLSLGYSIARIDERGFHRGTLIDHLAFVVTARCGPTCSVRLDCSCGCGSREDDAVFERGVVLAVNMTRKRWKKN